jgi:hypothetical protein
MLVRSRRQAVPSSGQQSLRRKPSPRSPFFATSRGRQRTTSRIGAPVQDTALTQRIRNKPQECDLGFDFEASVTVFDLLDR